MSDPPLQRVPWLSGHFVFLSASFPSGERGERFTPYDPGSITDAVVAVVRGVLDAGGQLVFGGHPTITPLVLYIASEMRVNGRVVVYQSRWFESRITPETRALAERGLGQIRWSEKLDDVGESLRHLRVRMFQETRPAAGFFVGGMEGIAEEWDLARDLVPHMVRVPFGRPGGAAAMLMGDTDVSRKPGHDLVTSDHYPVLVRNVLLMVSPHDDSPQHH